MCEHSYRFETKRIHSGYAPKENRDLGDVRSLIVNSPETTHGEFTQELKDLADIPRNLVRISVGLENADDLIEDLKQAFQTAFDA